MKVQLVVVQGKPEGMVIPLAHPHYKIGRGEGCQLRPNSDLVSREHAEFSVGADTVLVQDLGSRNGTEVNGKRLPANQPQALKTGDLIKVGTLTFAISIEGAPSAKPSVVLSGGSGARKKSLDDISGDEIDAWLVSDESRPTPERPSGVYSGETITLATYQGQEKEKTKATPPAPQPAPTPSARPMPPVPQPVRVAAPVVKAPEPVPVAVVPPPPPPVPVPVAVVSPPPPPPQVAPAPPVLPAPVAEAEEPMMNPLFNFVMELDNVPESEEPSAAPAEYSEVTNEDDGIEDLAALQAADQADDPAESMVEEFVDESNPFYVKKKPAEAPAATKPGVGLQDSSTAADQILRRLHDRGRKKR